jgi:hypothetical protein
LVTFAIESKEEMPSAVNLRPLSLHLVVAVLTENDTRPEEVDPALAKYTTNVSVLINAPGVTQHIIVSPAKFLGKDSEEDKLQY